MVTTCYLINKCPSTIIHLKTPIKMWSGRPTDHSHLRVFGYLAYVHVKQDKLDSRAKRYSFIEYLDGVKGYKLWNLEPGEAKCVISRDVVLNESTMTNLVKYLAIGKTMEDDHWTLQFEVEAEKTSGNLLLVKEQVRAKTESDHNT